MDKLKEKYFDWLCDIIDTDDYCIADYLYLLEELYYTKFFWILNRDRNRAEEGLNMRYKYAYEHDIEYDTMDRIFNDIPCSVLEMLVALSWDIENRIMFDSDKGDQTGYWFWIMISNLGLDDLTNDRFNGHYVQNVLSDFMNRNYDKDGKGGIFIIEDPPKDLRDVEIWYQACWYLNSIMDI